MRVWSEEAAAYARLIAAMTAAGLLTDSVLAQLPDNTAYLAEQRQRATCLWHAVEQHADPQQWLEALDQQDVNELFADIGLVAHLREAMQNELGITLNTAHLVACVTLYRADVEHVAGHGWRTETVAFQRLATILRAAHGN